MSFPMSYRDHKGHVLRSVSMGFLGSVWVQVLWWVPLRDLHWSGANFAPLQPSLGFATLEGMLNLRLRLMVVMIPVAKVRTC